MTTQGTQDTVRTYYLVVSVRLEVLSCTGSPQTEFLK